MTAVLEVADLRVELTPGADDVVDGISFSIDRGEVVGLVGESGSGKTTVALAMLGCAKGGTRIAAGSVRVASKEILGLDEAELRAVRGEVVSYIPQDPAAALNPALPIGLQLTEVITAHQREARSETARTRVREVLDEVRLPSDDAFLHRYPFQLSGGQQQRMCIAMAFLLRPHVIILDEPTTGLDVTTQAHILKIVRELCDNHGVGALYVSHDLGAVARLAQRTLVMYAGRLVEIGPTDRLFVRPGHPYTRKLIAAIPDIASRRALEPIPGHVAAPGRRPAGCVFAPRCPEVLPVCSAAEPEMLELDKTHHVACVRGLEGRPSPIRLAVDEERTAEPDPGAILVVHGLGAGYGSRQVLHDVSLEVSPQECLALVGESGSGKTTLARSIMGLHPTRAGEIRFKDILVRGPARQRPVEVRQGLQYIFQNPFNSLNPRHTIGEIIRVPIEHFFNIRGRTAADQVNVALERVSLPTSISAAYPDELSGGERQRVAIARALACKPDVLICDEITSALDVSVQATIVRLLEELREQERLSLLFVTHNLALVRTIADRVIVLQNGAIVETGPTSEVIDKPTSSYTRTLIADTPTLYTVPQVAAAGAQSSRQT